MMLDVTCQLDMFKDEAWNSLAIVYCCAKQVQKPGNKMVLRYRETPYLLAFRPKDIPGSIVARQQLPPVSHIELEKPGTAPVDS